MREHQLKVAVKLPLASVVTVVMGVSTNRRPASLGYRHRDAFAENRPLSENRRGDWRRARSRAASGRSQLPGVSAHQPQHRHAANPCRSRGSTCSRAPGAAKR
jgi:hypothetical protein